MKLEMITQTLRFASRMIHDLHCTLKPRIRQMSIPMNGQTLSPTCAHHIIGIEKASNLVHILTALAISDLKLQAKHLGLSLVRSNRQTDLICLEESPISLLNLFCAPEHPSTTRRRHTVCLWLRGHRDVGRAQEGNRKKASSRICRTRFEADLQV